MTTRRKIVFALGAGVLAAPVAAFAQQPGRVWRVGCLAQGDVIHDESDIFFGAFTQGMRELGYVTGKNLAIEWRSAGGDSARLPELAAELVRLKPDVLVARGTPAARAAQKATATIPIVMASMGDPIGSGLVKSLARPGGNSTGLSIMIAELAPKLMELLHATVPKAKRVAVLVNPTNASSTMSLTYILAVEQKIGIKVQSVEASSPQEIANGFAEMARQRAEALIVPRESLFSQQRSQIVELAAMQRLPSIGGGAEHAEGGFLLSYGQNFRENFKRAAVYVDKIIKGANPGDLPVEQPTRFELVVNLKTAKALGIEVPQSILLQATKVIE